MNNLKLIRKKDKGFTLVELILTLAVMAIISFVAFQSLNKNYEDNMAASSGQQIKDVGMAVNNYIVNHYDVLSKLQNATGSASDPGPRTCTTANSTCVITTITLSKEGLLPPSFNNKNVYGAGYEITLRRSGTTPYWNVTGLITTDKALTLGGRNGQPRYDLLGKAMLSAGPDSGMVRTSPNKLDGYKGTWSALSSDYSNIKTLGTLGFQAGYGSNSYSAFLRRDGTLPMTGDLNLGTKNIYGAANITASGKGTFGGEVQAGSWVHSKNGYGDTMSIGGDGAGDDYEIRISNPNRPITVYSASGPTKMRVTGTLTADQGLVSNNTLTVKNNGSFGGRIGTNGLSPDDLPNAWGGGVRTWDIFAGGTIAIKQNGQSNNNVWAFSANQYGDLAVSRNINASGNINSGGTTSGNYLKANSVAVAGQWCSDNGLISKDWSGAILSCVSNIWSKSSGVPAGTIAIWGTGAIPSGWLECNGQGFDRNRYPELARAYPGGAVPDFRGVFLRGLDRGAGRDSDPWRGVLSYQNDALQDHTHIAGTETAYHDNVPGSPTRNTPGGEEIRTYSDRTGNVNTAWGGARISNETRPKNNAVIYIIKAE